jgi:hypothetical protein
VRRSALLLLAVAGVAVAAVAQAAITRIDDPAIVGELAVRVPPDRSSIGGCPVFPDDNPWNRRVDSAPLRPESSAMIAAIQSTGGTRLHPDFGENARYGIPFVVVGPTQPEVPVVYTAYGDESDPGPFPVPADAPVEGGPDAAGDRHVIVLRSGTCELFELYRAFPSGGGWRADSGARFDLRSNELRPLGWTSADAAGLPILPGLVRYEEVASGAITHAIRVTFSRTQDGYVLPATHAASNRSDPALPPMGLRLRLSSSFDLDSLTGQARIIATAMQRYGLIVADNGSNWYFQGAPSPFWDDDDLGQLKAVTGDWFEVVDTGPIRR